VCICYVSVCVCLYVCVYIYIYMYIHIYTHTSTPNVYAGMETVRVCAHILCHRADEGSLVPSGTH
jgi:hypothetical protein